MFLGAPSEIKLRLINILSIKIYGNEEKCLGGKRGKQENKMRTIEMNHSNFIYIV